MDLRTLILNMIRDGYFAAIAGNRLAQFGTPNRAYLGAELLPDRQVPQNAYREEGIRYRTVIANDGTRYSPTQKKGTELVGSFLVELANSDIAREITAADYDAILRAVANSPELTSQTLIEFLDTEVMRGMIENDEKRRWQAIVNAQVLLVGDNGYAETVAYSNPASHRTNSAAPWSGAVDPMEEILAKVDLLAGKGFTVSRIIAPRTVVSILSANDEMKKRAGRVTVSATGQIQATNGRADLASLNQAFALDGLPAIETYDRQYRTQSGTGFFLPRNAMVFVASTQRDVTVDQGDNQRLLADTLGYNAVGTAAGQRNPGRVVRAEAKEDKPPRIEAEGWSTTLPVILEPEAIAVIGAIS